MEASLAQALVTQSAAMRASRASVKLGLIGVILSASVVSCSMVVLPVGTSPLAPAGLVVGDVVHVRPGERVDGVVRRVGEAADAVEVVVGEAAELVGGVRPLR